MKQMSIYFIPFLNLKYLELLQADRSNMYNRAKFLQNGKCGYVLKPIFMQGLRNTNYVVAQLKENEAKVNQASLSDASTYSLTSTDWLSRIPGRKVSQISSQCHNNDDKYCLNTAHVYLSCFKESSFGDNNFFIYRVQT